MPFGKCALCRLQKQLQKSHLIPASMFRIIRKSQGSDPVFMTAKRIGTSSRQITAHELCWDCEQLFRKNGEDWMAGQVFQGNHFPLLNSFRYAMADWRCRTMPLILERLAEPTWKKSSISARVCCGAHH